MTGVTDIFTDSASYLGMVLFFCLLAVAVCWFFVGREVLKICYRPRNPHVESVAEVERIRHDPPARRAA